MVNFLKLKTKDLKSREKEEESESEVAQEGGELCYKIKLIKLKRTTILYWFGLNL